MPVDNQPPQRKVIHVDMDAFFSSVEQRDNPELRGRPVAVGSPAARGVVAAASYEARAFGVHSAMPSVTAMRKCADLIFVPPRFEVYRAVSAQIREVFAEYTPLIEPLSLDEAYLDVTENLKGMEIATEIAEEIRTKIRDRTGLTASAGVSYNKFLAKMASDQRKPDGLFVITPRQGEAFVAQLPVRKFHGVGPATAERMKSLGIETGADLKLKPLAFLEQHFGKSGAYFHGIARGIDLREVRPDRIRKSVGAEDTFTTDIVRLEEAEREIAPLIAKVWRYCEANDIRGRTITVKIRYADFRQITRSRSAQSPIQTQEDLRGIAESIIAAEFPVPGGVRLLGVTLSALSGPEMDQLAFDI